MAGSLILLNARLWSPDGAGPGAGAIVAEGDRISALTTTAQARSLARPGARVIDLGGRLAIPAFGDAHVHPVGGGLESLRCNLAGLRTRAGYLRVIADHARTLEPDGWVLGGGWSMEAFPGGLPVATDLVAVAGGRPVFLPNRDHHSAWVSPAALARAGITRDTPDPADGRIERDASGAPAGTLHDGAMRLVSRLIPPPAPAELAAGLRAGQQHLHALGITHWQDAIVGDAPDIGIPDAFGTYCAAAAQGWLTAQVNGALWWDRRAGLGQLPGLLARRRQAPGGTFRATSVKMMLDGVCETLTAAMTEPYAGRAGHTHRGELFVSQPEAAEAVRLLSREGFQVHFHAIGDRAVHAALDAVAGVPADDLRHHVAHLQFIRPEDLDRFAGLGVVANFQPLWATHDPQMQELTLPFVGPERARWQYRIGTLARRGARLAFGSDWPVSSADPLQQIHVAVNRVLSPRLGRPGTPETERPFLAAEAVPLSQAVAAFTSGVAHINHRERELGSLRPGYRADIAVLSQDIFARPAAEIGDARVDLTIAGGRVV
ncbi:MAG TPA: amidohydrolase, partial [Streptosporangiaceae bacterium]